MRTFRFTLQRYCFFFTYASLLQIKCKLRKDLRNFMQPRRSRSSVLGKKDWLYSERMHIYDRPKQSAGKKKKLKKRIFSFMHCLQSERARRWYEESMEIVAGSSHEIFCRNSTRVRCTRTRKKSSFFTFFRPMFW